MNLFCFKIANFRIRLIRIQFFYIRELFEFGWRIFESKDMNSVLPYTSRPWGSFPSWQGCDTLKVILACNLRNGFFFSYKGRESATHAGCRTVYRVYFHQVPLPARGNREVYTNIYTGLAHNTEDYSAGEIGQVYILYALCKVLTVLFTTLGGLNKLPVHLPP